MTKRDDDKSLARNLGEFFGHIWSGVKADPKSERQKQTLRRETEEQNQPATGGKVTLRRTTVEEVEYEPDLNASDQASDDDPTA